MCAQSTLPAPPPTGATKSSEPKTWPYTERVLARASGNVGRWWSLLKDEDKTIFLDGFQEGMRDANQLDHNTCEVIRQQAGNDSQSSFAHLSAVVYVCSREKETSGYEAVTVKDLDTFYAEVANQFIPVWWATAYLRDRACARQTEGQLLDSLNNVRKIMSRPSQ